MNLISLGKNLALTNLRSGKRMHVLGFSTTLTKWNKQCGNLSSFLFGFGNDGK